MNATALSAERGPDVRHGNEHTVRVVGVAERPKAKFRVEFPAALEMIVLKHIENDGRSTHLVCDLKAASHGVHQQCRAKTLALHVGAHRDGANVDLRIGLMVAALILILSLLR